MFTLYHPLKLLHRVHSRPSNANLDYLPHIQASNIEIKSSFQTEIKKTWLHCRQRVILRIIQYQSCSEYSLKISVGALKQIYYINHPLDHISSSAIQTLQHVNWPESSSKIMDPLSSTPSPPLPYNRSFTGPSQNFE